MRITDLFERSISRPINGVVKADQLDDSSVWQELDEFVVTKELDHHFRRFFSAYLDAIDHRHDPDVAGKIGVWVSGFFGSGKSHFIKVLSYLLQNSRHTSNGQSKQAIEFFESKISDAMLFGDIKRAVASHADVILFNIDSKADNKAGRDAILSVFLKVLNEMQGYSGDHPHIAHMERYLVHRGKLEQFQVAYRDATGTEWVDERDAYQFNRDEVVQALSTTLGQSQESAEKWVDGAEDSFALTVENFCTWVKEYLDAKGPEHRLVFLVDEVGQFIGGDTHLMLNLQTITENLGTTCGGRAWVVVTSQEDIDAVLGEMQTSRANDFSKIQGRFRTRLSLSSANVDEVIQSRLLAKKADVTGALHALFTEKGDILKHQLTFSHVGMTLRPYRDSEDFVKNYPFAPYQFQLVQKIFEAIRKVGATGLHLSRGERSILDAFQSAGKQLAESEIGVLVPLYRFYPSIESFLDTAVKRTIDQAGTNPSLEPFDIHVLQVLFLIRYVEEIKANVDNMVTLCIDEIDADRLALRRRIEDSLQRLENETLISRSGDNYFFLTNEEQDIKREVNAVELHSGAEARQLGELIFNDVLKDRRKYRFSANKMDFSFNRLCDQHPIGNRLDGALFVSVITPLADEYELYDKARCILDSNNEGGQVLIRLGNDESLGRELRTYLQTDKYVRHKSDGSQPDPTKRILRDMAEDNQDRRTRLTNLLSEMFVQADYFVAGQSLTLKAITPDSLNPEELTLLDPACGSGHILVEAYELLKEIYLERGYRIRDIPTLILQKNLFGLEIDDRAAQLAAFALMMKARADDRRVFGREVQPQVLSIQESKGLNAKQLTDAINAPVVLSKRPDSDEFEFMEDVNTPLFSKKNLAVKGEIEESDIAALVALFEKAKTLGSLITVSPELAEKLPTIAKRVKDVLAHGDLVARASATALLPLIEQTQLLLRQYDVAVTNPPYMGNRAYNSILKEFVHREHESAKSDLYACFLERNLLFVCHGAFIAMITIPNWMFLSSFGQFRESLNRRYAIDSLIHNGRGVWGSDFGSCSLVIRKLRFPDYGGSYRRLFETQGSVATNEELRERFFSAKTYLKSPKEFAKIPSSPIAYWGVRAFLHSMRKIHKLQT